MLKQLHKNFVDFSVNFVLAILVLSIGLFAIRYLDRFIKSRIGKSHIDKTLKPFLYTTIVVALKILLIVIVVRIIGIENGSIVAVLGGASLAIGLAFQGTLANLASGIILLFMKPLRAGDYVEILGKEGIVEGIHFFFTELTTVDNKVVFVPNARILNNELTNYSIKSTRRIEQVYSVDYASDIDFVKRILFEEIRAIPYIMKEPEPLVALSECAESSMNFVVRVWVKSEHYWVVHFALLDLVKKRLDKENISIPFPIIDLRNNK